MSYRKSVLLLWYVYICGYAVWTSVRRSEEQGGDRNIREILQLHLGLLYWGKEQGIERGTLKGYWRCSVDSYIGEKERDLAKNFRGILEVQFGLLYCRKEQGIERIG